MLSSVACLSFEEELRSFVVGSYRASETQDHPTTGSYRLYLSGCSGSPILCSSVTAQSQIAPDNGPTSVTAFVITFNGGIEVQRGALSYASGATQQTATLSPALSPSSTMVWNALGMGPGVMMANQGSGDLMFQSHQRLKQPSSTTVQGHRGASGATAVGTWEAVQWRTTTNYRSIGTAADYGVGTVDVTGGSVSVIGTGTSWQGVNRGRGDVITIPCPDPPACTGGTDYTVRGVDSNTTLRLTQAFVGATASGVSYLIRRQFTTLDASEDCIDGPPGAPCTYFPVSSDSLVADDRSEVGIAYEDSVFTLASTLVIDGRIDNQNTDASHTITLTADGANRHYGLKEAGVRLDLSGNNFPAIEIMDNFVTVEWLEIEAAGTGSTSSDGIRVSGLSAVNKIVLRNNLIHGIDAGKMRASAIRIVNGDTIADVYNNIVYNARVGILIDTALAGSSRIRILNNTVYTCNRIAGPSGIVAEGAASYPTVILRNNIAHSSTTADYGVPGLDLVNSSHNLASDSTGSSHSSGATGLDSVPLGPGPGTVSFVNTTLGSEDLHIQSGSAAESTGADLSSIFAFDVDDGGRQAPWDRGADDIAATTEVELLAFGARGMDRAVELTWETASELLSRRHARLGDAFVAAQESYAASGAFPELLQIYLLLGDPALPLPRE